MPCRPTIYTPAIQAKETAKMAAARATKPTTLHAAEEQDQAGLPIVLPSNILIVVRTLDCTYLRKNC